MKYIQVYYLQYPRHDIPIDFSVIKSMREKFPGYNSEFPVCTSIYIKRFGR